LVPWARHDAGHTPAFDDQVAWLVTHTTKSTVSRLMRIAWRLPLLAVPWLHPE
jgi:hypothetical protein